MLSILSASTLSGTFYYLSDENITMKLKYFRNCDGDDERARHFHIRFTGAVVARQFGCYKYCFSLVLWLRDGSRHRLIG